MATDAIVAINAIGTIQADFTICAFKALKTMLTFVAIYTILTDAAIHTIQAIVIGSTTTVHISRDFGVRQFQKFADFHKTSIPQKIAKSSKNRPRPPDPDNRNLCHN